MGFVKKTKTSDKWFRINELVRKHPRLAGVINNSQLVIDKLSEMNAVLQTIATQSGLTELPGPADQTLQAIGFPLPKMIWMGTLAYDIHDDDGKKVNEPRWRLLAKELRDIVYAIVEADRLVADAFNTDISEDPNPGGKVKGNPRT